MPVAHYAPVLFLLVGPSSPVVGQVAQGGLREKAALEFIIQVHSMHPSISDYLYNEVSPTLHGAF